MDLMTMIVMIIFFILAIILIVLSYLASQKIKKNCTVEVEAIVEGYSHHHSYTTNHRHRVPIYGYDYFQTHYTTEAKIRWFSKIELGTKQKLIIDPHNPQDCYKKSDLFFPRCLPILGIYILLLVFFIGINIF